MFKDGIYDPNDPLMGFLEGELLINVESLPVVTT